MLPLTATLKALFVGEVEFTSGIIIAASHPISETAITIIETLLLYIFLHFWFFSPPDSFFTTYEVYLHTVSLFLTETFEVLTEVRQKASHKSFYRDDNETEKELTCEYNSGYTCTVQEVGEKLRCL